MFRWKVTISRNGSTRTGIIPAYSVTEIPDKLNEAGVPYDEIIVIKPLECIECKDKNSCLNNAISEFVSDGVRSTDDVPAICSGYENIMSQF